MGLLSIFKKKPTTALEKQVAPTINPDVYLLEVFRDSLAAMGYRVEWHEQYLALIINGALELAAIIVDTRGLHPNLIQLMVVATHGKYFPDGIVDNLVGAGTSFEEQVTLGVRNYLHSFFPAMTDALSDSHNSELDFVSITDDREVLWHPVSGPLLCQGQWIDLPHNKLFFDLLKDKIIDRLTPDKINWLTIYISKRAGDNEIIGACLFNNEPWDAGTTALFQYAETWQLPGEFQGAKQFIMFRRCDLYDDNMNNGE